MAFERTLSTSTTSSPADLHPCGHVHGRHADPPLQGANFDPHLVPELGVKVGDVVGFPKNMDYRIKIDGKEYYRTRAQDFLYVEE